MSFIPDFLAIFAQFPKLAGVVGLIIAIAFGFLGLSSWYTVQSMPEAPLSVSLNEAVAIADSGKQVWVEINEVVWDCQNIVYRDVNQNVRTYIIFTDEGNSILGRATFSGPTALSCEEIQHKNASGVLSVMSDGVLEKMPELGFNLDLYEHAQIAVSLCTFCGRGNSFLLFIFSLIMIPLGLCLYPLSLSLRKSYWGL